jgi:hypothetical protein
MFKILLILGLLFFGAAFIFSLILKKMKRIFIGNFEDKPIKKSLKQVTLYDDGKTKVMKDLDNNN